MTILKNILSFTGLTVGVPQTQPHRLNLNDVQPLLPQFAAANAGGFTINVTDVTVTVTRTPAASTAAVQVYVEHWHTIEEVLPPGNLAGFVPFLIQPGGAGVDTGIIELTTDVLAGPGSGIQAATVVALQGNAVAATAPAASNVLTWTGAAWAPAPTATTGITQLTNDVTAGPGTGAQAATVTALQGNAVAIAAPAPNQVLSWNGSAWVPGSVSSGSSGGGGVIYYLNQGTAPQAPTVNLPAGVQQFGQVAEIAGATVTSGVLPTVGSVVVASFVTDVGVPGLTAIPAGIWDYNVWAQSATSTTANEILLIYEVYTYDGVNPPTLIAASPDIAMFDPTALIQYIGSAIVPQTPILVTDRIFVEIHAYATTPGQTVTIAFGGSFPSHVHTTLPSISGTGIAHVVNGAFVSPASPVVLSSATEVTGVLPIANGGTNTATAPANGQLLIGNAGAYTVANLTAGTNITITPGPGTITIAATGASVGGAEFQWGVEGISGSTTVRALPRGWSDDTAVLIPGSGISIYDFAAVRAGTLRNLFVRQNTAGTGAVIATYTIAINGVATALAVNLSTGPIGQASNLVNTVVVAQGDRIRLQVTKAAPIANSNLNIQATVEFA